MTSNGKYVLLGALFVTMAVAYPWDKYTSINTAQECYKCMNDKSKRFWGIDTPRFDPYCCKASYTGFPWDGDVYKCIDSDDSRLPGESKYMMCPNSYDECGGSMFIISSNESLSQHHTPLIYDQEFCKFQLLNGDSNSDMIAFNYSDLHNVNASIYYEHDYGDYTLAFNIEDGVCHEWLIPTNHTKAIWLFMKKGVDQPDFLKIDFEATALVNGKPKPKPDDDPSNSSSSWKAVGIIFILSTVILLIMLILCFWYYRRKLAEGEDGSGNSYSSLVKMDNKAVNSSTAHSSKAKMFDASA